MTRFKIILLSLLCIILSPLLLLGLLIQACVGDINHTLQVESDLDMTGDEALGGDIGLTVSASVGNAMVMHEPWGYVLGYIIDLIMGKGHCLSNATINSNK